MALTLYYHPFSSFCQKVLIALYELNAPFAPRLIDFSNPDDRADLARAWPMAKFPVLRDDQRGVSVPESSLIIAYLDHYFPGPTPLIPLDFDSALKTHQLDRLIDNHVLMSVTKIVTDTFREEGRHDEDGVAEARGLIGKAYDLFEGDIGEKRWAAGDSFTLADCGAAPALFYANTIVPLDGHPKLSAYYRRLLERPSVARVVDEARPFRNLFPLPWPAGYE